MYELKEGERERRNEWVEVGKYMERNMDNVMMEWAR